ncbi:alanine/ornithine racemase family PLP-dependent enzyme [Natranaerobius trueperi]|uniref:Alanine racemase n=1 Tax=Natranaerobius trueperi TaxID=759412 RepID=A0A226BY74_9FIRM|nr:alanine/ornithine racemase family PLP-dependent enzyme [Natranaerobius trueperi]OWZ83067.1 alanine racemase [Natranaerobius trueperi]
MAVPKIEVNFEKLVHNVDVITSKCKEKGISVMGVTKAVLAHPRITDAYIKGGLEELGDSRIQNIKRLRDYGFTGEITLLRSPMQSEISDVISFADVSLVTELKTLKAMNKEAKLQNKEHSYIVMVDVGDRREGILPEKFVEFVQKAQAYENLNFKGIGLNVGCFGGVLPTFRNAQIIADLKQEIEKKGIDVSVLSGGNSCGVTLVFNDGLPKEINQLRVGEGFLLGMDSVRELKIPNTHQDAFKLVAEIIEIKQKPSLPEGEIGKDPFGNVPEFTDQGIRTRAIAAVGKQDVSIEGLIPIDNKISIEGASSDHLIIDITDSQCTYDVGEKVEFNMTYGAVLSAMTSPYIDIEVND